MIELTNKNLYLLFTLLMGPISIILLVISVYLIQPKVEAKLASSVRLELAKHNIKTEVSFSGRDGILKGEVDSQEIADNAQRISLAVFGTRVIRNYLNVRAKQDNFVPAPIIKKISYAIRQPEKERISKEKSKPVFISEVDKIMANMRNIKKPIVQYRLANITKPTKDKLIVDDSNELLHIINTFNSSLDDTPDRKVLSPNKQNPDSISVQKLEEIDLSTLYFSDNSTVLSQKAHPILNKVSKAIKAQSLSYIELIAYAKDSDIGYARGVAIREYLAMKGVQKNIIHISGHTLLDTDNKKITFEILSN